MHSILATYAIQCAHRFFHSYASWNDQNQFQFLTRYLGLAKRIWYLLPMRAAKVQASLRIQAVSQEKPSDGKPDPWTLWMAGHAQLKFVMTECSKTQICLTQYLKWRKHLNGRKLFIYMTRSTTKPAKLPVHPMKTQIRLGIHPVWSGSSLCTLWIGKDPTFLHANSDNSDQTGWMPRFIWIFTGCTGHFAGFVMHRLKYKSRSGCDSVIEKNFV